MTERLPRLIAFFAPAAVMSAWATVMLHSLVSGQIKELLSPLFRDYVLIASILLLVLSALYLFLYQPPAATSPRGWLRSTGRWLVLLVPVIVAAMLSPTTLSGTTVANRSPSAGTAPMSNWKLTTQDNSKALLDSDPNQPVPVEVTDLIALSHEPEQMKTFEGRKVRLVGLLNRATGGDPTIFRWIMFCCAADAQPAAVQLTGKADGNWKDTQWLEVTGTARFPTTLGHTVPTIELDSIKPTGEPDEPYLSP